MTKLLPTEFILLGLTSIPHLKMFLFIIFFIFFLFNLLENICILTVVIIDLHLHIPMYFFLGNLSFLDIFYSSAIVPKMLAGLLIEDNRISFQSCISQMFFYHFLGCTDALILTAMSYDRYVAICNPLRYNVLMAKSVCILLASSCWVTGFVYSLIHPILASKLPFCKLNQINHISCEIKPLLKLACADTYLNESLVTIISGFLAVSTFLFIFITYVFICTHLLNIRSSQGRRKAFSACTSHLTVVLLYYVAGFSAYLGPAREDSQEQSKRAAVLITVITPALNPLIYSLRNKQVKDALKKIFLGKQVLQRITDQGP
ncbi:hypothetical protein FKM82_015943 [Ascaphus truei]